MKKVLLLTHDYPPKQGGVASYLRGIYSRYPEDQVVLLLDVSLQQKIEKQPADLWHAPDNGPKVIYTQFWSKWIYPKWIPLLFRVVRLINDEQITEVHVSHVQPLGTLCYLLWKWKKIPYRIYFHGMDIALARRKQFKRGVLQNTIRHADIIVANSEFTKSLVAGEVNRDVVVWNPHIEPATIPHEAAVESFKDQFALHGKTVFFTVARLVKRKGIDLVIDAMREVVKQNANVVYVVAGNGPEVGHLHEQVKTHGLQNSVRFIGPISEEDKAIWYSVADCFVMPTRNTDPDIEGFGIVYIEAAQHGIPSIASAAGGAQEAVLHNRTGLVIPPEDHEALIAALIAMANDGGYREQLGRQAQEHAQTLEWGENIPEELL